MRFLGNGFLTSAPDGWDDRSVVTLVGPAGADGFVPNIVVTRDRIDADTTLEKYVADQSQLLQSAVGDLELLDEERGVLHGMPAVHRTVRCTAEGRVMVQRQTYVQHRRTIIVVTCTASVDTYSTHAEDFRRFVDELRFSGAGA